MTVESERALVFGGSSGMGLATARAMAQAGAEVVIAGRSQARLDAALAALPAGVSAAAADFGDRPALDALMARLGRIDHLVLAGAGAAAWGPFAQVGLDALRDAFEVKLFGYWNALQAALPVLRRDGSVTMLTGAASRTAMPQTAGLAAVNGGIERVAQTLALELAPLRVNVVSPGLVDTPAYDGMPEAARRGMFEAAARALPAGRTGRPEDVAAAVLFLAANGFTTGAILDVDGGARMARAA